MKEVMKILSLPPLLELIGTVTIAVTTELFIARAKFVVDTSRKVKVKIRWIGDNFENWFLGKTEAPAPKTSLRYCRLTRSELDSPIMTELGEAKETTLAAVYALMELQGGGEQGALLTTNNGGEVGVNIFFRVRDASNTLRAVRVFWRRGGWGLDAESIADSRGWRVGCRVFSRDS